MTNMTTPGDGGAKDDSKIPPRSLGTGPDCRARRILGMTRFSDCLVPPWRDCEFALNFGNGRFCDHPDHALIAARTEAEGTKPTS
jgi:hypothetical protein